MFLEIAWNQWKVAAHGTALLRRVFQNAVDLWGERIGAAGYEAEFAFLQRTFSAWQLGMHTAREERRERMLELAADRNRRRHLAGVVLQALRETALNRIELEAMMPLCRASLLAWHFQVMHHSKGALARQGWADRLKTSALLGWRTTTEESALRYSTLDIM